MLAVCTAGALLLAGCGGGGGSSTTSADARPDTNAVATPDVPVVTLSFGPKRITLDWTTTRGALTWNVAESIDAGATWTTIAADLDSTHYDHEVPVHFRADAQYIVRACDGTDCVDSTPVAVGAGLVGAIGYLRPASARDGDSIGQTVAVSGDGNYLAVGAPGDDGDDRGINQTGAPDGASDSGAVWIYAKNGSTWTQQARIKGSLSRAGDTFGSAVALNFDGSLLVVGAPSDDSDGTGVNPNIVAYTKADSGAVYVLTRSGSAWSEQAYLKASNSDPGDRFGSAISISSDGATIAVGAVGEDGRVSGTTGLGQNDNNGGSTGAVYVFVRPGPGWTQQAYLKAAVIDDFDVFGRSVALSGDGSMLVVGAPGDDSSATTVGGNANDNSGFGNGAALVFQRSGTTWGQVAYLKATNSGQADSFGDKVAVSRDGTTIAVGAWSESATGSGVNNPSARDGISEYLGAVYIFTGQGAVWQQTAYIKASNAAPDAEFGRSLALSGDGTVLAVGAPNEKSRSSGINGDQSTANPWTSGAAYVFTRAGGVWSQKAYVKSVNTFTTQAFGSAVGLSNNGNVLAVGAQSDMTGSPHLVDENLPEELRGAVYLY